jgi:hypothetical protein
MEDRSNLMEFSNGTHPHDRYLGTQVSPLTLLTDPEIPVNRYRFGGLQRTVSALRDFHARTGLVLGVTLFGEAHQLYANFKDGGGAEGDVMITDYSPASVAEFQRWLAVTFDHSLERLNRRLRSRYQDWEDIHPPRSAVTGSILEYLDSYAHGVVPVEGWCSPMEEVSAVEVWVGERLAGCASLGMSRPDVTEHLQDVSDLNTGFRYSLDIRGIPEGTHRIRVIAVTRNGQSTEVGERRLTILSGGVSSTGSRFGWWRYGFRKLRSSVATHANIIRHWLDLPPGDLQVLYNPLAELWYHYRCHQVEGMLEAMWSRAVDTGFPRKALYSHQILIPFFGRRSDYLYATGSTLRRKSVYNPGVTLYGGQTVNASIPALFGKRSYAVTEFHPLSVKNPALHQTALALHRSAGARWVAPYFLSAAPMENADPGQRRFWIHPTNPEYGSDSLYRAIKGMCTH